MVNNKIDILKYKKEMIDYINSLDAKQLEEAIVKAGAKKEKMKSYKENKEVKK